MWPGGVISASRAAAPPVRTKVGVAGPGVDYAHVAPEYPATHARAQGLGAGFLGRESLGVAGGAAGLPLERGALSLGEDRAG